MGDLLEQLADLFETHDPDHPDIARVEAALAQQWIREGSVEEGAVLLEKALTVLRNHPVDPHWLAALEAELASLPAVAASPVTSVSIEDVPEGYRVAGGGKEALLRRIPAESCEGLSDEDILAASLVVADTSTTTSEKMDILARLSELDSEAIGWFIGEAVDRFLAQHGAAVDPT